jgi:23S rRNA (uracil1939-C5)-methyltransferase
MSGAEILRLAARGDGVTADGRYIAYTAPGDLVAADGSVTRGPHHIDPACRHFPDCGGCQLQHVDDASLAPFLVDRIGSALAAQGIETNALRPPHVSPAHSRRRASLRAERRGKQALMGFNAAKSNRVIDLGHCPVLHPTLEALIKPLRALLATLVPDRRSANVRLTLADQGVDLLLSEVEADGLAATEALTRFAQTHKLARLSLDEGFGPAARWEPEPVTVTLGGVPVALPEGAFLQATADGEAALVAAVKEATQGDIRVGTGRTGDGGRGRARCHSSLATGR